MHKKILTAIITSEAIFYGYCKWQVQKFEANVKPFNESDQPFPFLRRRKIVEKLFEREFVTKERGKRWLEGWFYHDQKLEDLTERDIRTFLSWAYFNKSLEKLNEKESNEIERDVKEKLRGFTFRSENVDSNVRILRPNMDNLHERILHKPLAFYFLSEIVVQRILIPLAMNMSGFRKKTIRGGGLKYWIHESSSSTAPGINATPIVFFHGVGIGVLPYISFFREIMRATVENRVLIVPEFPVVSLTVPIDIGTTPEETSTLLMKMLKENNVQRAILIGHSYGVWPLSWMLRYHSKTSDLNVVKSIFIDPVNVGVHRANLCRSFLYDPVHTSYKTSSHLYKFMLTQTLNRDARVVATFMRNIRWYESLLLEELENIDCEKMTFFFSERDSYMESEQDYYDVKKYQCDCEEKQIDAKLWCNVIHGEFLIRDKLRKNVLNEILVLQ